MTYSFLEIEEVEKILESKPKFITKTLSFNLEVLKHIFEHNSLNYDGQDHKIEELPIKIGKVNEENSNVEFSLIECADVTWNWINELRELQGGLKATKEETIKINSKFMILKCLIFIEELYEN